MADPRYYAKLDVGYFDNPKTAELLEEHPRVLILHLRAITYCRQHLLDGTFPLRLVVRMACASYCGSQCEGQCDVCLGVLYGLFSSITATTADVHDYLEHQDSSESVKARKAAGKKGAAARWNGTDRNADRSANGNAKERRGEERSSRAGAREADGFEAFYELYPKKVGRGQASKAYRAALKKSDAETILGGLKAHLPAWKNTDRQFIPNPSTWLNGERWEDEVEASAEPDPLAFTPSVEELQRRRGF